MNKVTIYDVAEEAGVGIGTVSRVLNNSEKVGDKTREKVLKAIEKLNYQPSAMARGLALQKTRYIGVMVPSFTDNFFVTVLKGVQQGLEKFNLDLVLFNVTDKKYKEKYIDRILAERRVDGVLAITMDITLEEVSRFRDVNLPLVLVDDLQEKVSSIHVDDIAGSKEAINYLLKLKHRKIAFLNGELVSRQGLNRLKGVELAFAEAGLDFDYNLLKTGSFTGESGYRLMKEILELEDDKKPTAIFAASDNQAVGALEAIEEAGLSVPDDFALVGFDDIELARYLKLTTVKQPMIKMGKLGIDILVQTICSKNIMVKEKLKPELVIRKSCK